MLPNDHTDEAEGYWRSFGFAQDDSFLESFASPSRSTALYFNVCKKAWISSNSCGLRITPMGGMGEVPRYS